MPETNTRSNSSAYTYNTNNCAEATDELIQFSYELRRAAQLLGGDGSSRSNKCGRIPFTTVTMGKKNQGKASYRGLIQCGSVWACNICSNRIMQKRRSEILKAMELWAEQDGFFYTETLTMPHTRLDKLKYLNSKMEPARQAWNKDRSVRDIRKKLGIAGYFRIIEAPHNSVNGWHPHHQYVYFTKRQLTQSELAEWKMVSQAKWRECLEAQGVIRVSSQAHYLDEVVDFQKLASYSTKYTDKAAAQGAGSLSIYFSVSNVTRSHWEILTAFKETKSNSDKHLWHEWISGMKGRHFITWSKGFLRSLGLAESPKDKEIIEEDEHTPLLIISAESVPKLVHNPRRQAQYLHLLKVLDFGVFLDVIAGDGIEYTLTQIGELLLERNTS